MVISENSFLEFLVIGAMPFLYGCATRLPFIYFVIHLSQHFEMQWLTIGFCVGGYQGCRVITSSVSIFAPKFSHFLGTAAGLAGYTIVYFSDKDIVAPFVAGTAIIGLSETMSSMQKYAKEMYKLSPDRKKTKIMLKLQYASVMVGVVFAFSIGGIVYQRYYIHGVALFGMIIEGSALLVCLIYLGFFKDPAAAMEAARIADVEIEGEKVKFPVKIDAVTGDEAGEDNGEKVVPFLEPVPVTGEAGDKEEKAVSFLPAQSPTAKPAYESIRRRRSLDSLIMSINRTYNVSDIPATWVNWLLCMTFGIEALTIGYNLSIGPIFILNQFNQGTGVIGLLFAVGGAAGAIAATGVTCTEFGSNAMNKIASAPFNLCIAMFGIGVAVLVAAIPSFPVHVIGLISLMCFNDLGATLMTELQGSITNVSSYSLLGPLGQVVRRSLNVVTALTGPVLFGIYPRMPYFVAGVITLLWATGMTIAFRFRVKETSNEISEKLGRNRKSVNMAMSFATREVVMSSLRHIDQSV